MTLDDLIETLTDLRDRFEDEGAADFTVKTALQPHYPLIGSLQNVCIDPTNKRIFLASSNGETYGCPRNAWDDEEVGESED